MKTPFPHRCPPVLRSWLWAPAAALTTVAGAAETTVLESFEDGIGAVQPWASGRATLGVYVVGEGDPGLNVGQVTDGQRALQVDLAAPGTWAQDFQVVLSSEASQALLDARASSDPHRYQLRIDFTFPVLNGSAGPWMNAPVDIQGIRYQVEANAEGTTRTFAAPLESLAGNLSSGTDGQGNPVVTIGFVTNGQWSAAVRLFVDNIRLVDTYAEGAEVVVTVLDSYEEGTGLLPVGPGWGARPSAGATEVMPYDSTGEGDPYVTEGESSAKVTLSAPGWSPDVYFDLTQFPELADILALPAAARSRYQLRWDFRYSTQTDLGWGIQLSTTELPMTLLAANETTFTYTIPMDLITANTINVVTNGGWTDGEIDLYIDNFRLVDTGTVPPADFVVTGFAIDDILGEVSLTWVSHPGDFYIVDWSPDGATWLELNDSIPSQGQTTTYVTQFPLENPNAFFRVGRSGQ